MLVCGASVLAATERDKMDTQHPSFKGKGSAAFAPLHSGFDSSDSDSDSDDGRIRHEAPSMSFISSPRPLLEGEEAPDRFHTTGAEDTQQQELLATTRAADPQEQQALLAITRQDDGQTEVDQSAFAKLVESVCGEALAKLHTQAASPTADTADRSPEDLAKVRAEVVGLQAASASMIANMHDIIAQMRGLVSDPKFLQEEIEKISRNSEAERGSSTSTSESQQSKQPGVSSVSISGSSQSNQREPGEQTPSPYSATASPASGTSASSPGVASSTMVSPTGSDGVGESQGGIGPLLLSSPGRMQLLKEALVKAGLRELLIDMTQEQAAQIQLETATKTSRAPVLPETAAVVKERVAAINRSSLSVPAGSKLLIENTSPAPSTSENRAEPSASTRSASTADAEVEAEVASSMVELIVEQGVISAEAQAAGRLLASPTPAPLHITTCSPSNVAAISLLCAPAPAGSPVASARSPRPLSELMKLELVKAVRQMEREEQLQRQAVRARKVAATRKKSVPSREATDSSSGSDSGSASHSDSSSVSSDEGRDRRHRKQKHGSRQDRRSSKRPPVHSSPHKDVLSPTAAEAASAARLALEMEKLNFERERLAWEGEKLKMQQAHFLQMQAQAQQAQEQAQKASEASSSAAAQAAAAAAGANSRGLEEQRLELERVKLALETEKLRMEQSRLSLESQLKEVQARASAPAGPVAQQPVHVTIHQSAPSAAVRSPDSNQHEEGGGRKPSRRDRAEAESKGATAEPVVTGEDDSAAMKRHLAAYCAKRQEKKERRERKERAKAEKEAAAALAAGKKPSKNGTLSASGSRRNSLTGATIVGSVSTTPGDVGMLRASHHRRNSSGNVSQLVDAPNLHPIGDMQPRTAVGAPPVLLSRGSTRNLLQPWSLAELSAPVPLKLFPSQADLDALSETDRSKALQVLALNARYDQAYRSYLDPSGSATEAALAQMQTSAASSSSSGPAPKTSHTIVTPALFLYLHLSVIDLHKLTWSTRPRPCIEIYSLRSGRPQLIFETEFAPGSCTAHEFEPIIVKVDEACYGQLERDICIRVTHIASSDSSGSMRQLVGEVWTNLFCLQAAPNDSKFPLLKPRSAPHKAHLPPKEKGILVLREQALFVRTDRGMVRYADAHPNRCLPATYPEIFERNTQCVAAFTVQCRSLATLLDARCSGVKKIPTTAASSSGSATKVKVIPYLEFFRLEEVGTWSSAPVLRTEEVWVGSTLVNSLANSGASALTDPHATLTWRPVQIPLFDLCFGDVRRNILVKLWSAGSATSTASKQLLASFQFQLCEILGDGSEGEDGRKSCVILDPHVQPAGANAANFLSGALPITPVTVAGFGGGGGGEMEGLAASDPHPSCILFHRAHVYSSLSDLQKLVQRAGIVVEPSATASNLDPARPLSRVISGLHRVLLEQSTRKAQGVDQSAKINFAPEPKSASSSPAKASAAQPKSASSSSAKAVAAEPKVSSSSPAKAIAAESKPASSSPAKKKVVVAKRDEAVSSPPSSHSTNADRASASPVNVGAVGPASPAQPPAAKLSVTVAPTPKDGQIKTPVMHGDKPSAKAK